MSRIQDAWIRASFTALCLALPAHAASAGGPGGAREQGGVKVTSPQLTSTRFQHEREIPPEFTCEGQDRSPPLAWTGLPAGTQSVALIVDDPDAPDPRAPKRTWVHWVVYNLPPQVTSLAEGLRPEGLPQGARSGKNDWGKTGYGGPCPPIGRHRYFFKLYALDRVLPDLGAPSKAQLEKAMEGHVLARAELVGTYEKKKQK